jgi:predicted nucleic acid-binding protein
LSAQAFVLDNSVAVAWALAEENPGAERVMDLLADGEARVPGIWPLEFANALLVAERRKRLTEAGAAEVRDIVLALPIRVVPESPDRVLTAVLALARQHGLSVHDATCLDLAMREGLPLATLDDRLRDAARRCGVPLLVDEPATPKPPRKACGHPRPASR